MKKRIISLAMALCLLLSGIAVLSSCKKEEGIKLSRKTAELEVKDYTIVYPDETNGNQVTTMFQDYMRAFAEKVSNAVGENLRAFSENKTRSKASDPEILVGLTSRVESQEALKSIKGNGYTIQVINNKIVLVGSTNLLTLAAVEYFENNYLEEDMQGKLTLHEKATLSGIEMITMADTTDGYYSFVYGADYDPDDPVSSYDTTASGVTTMTRYAYNIVEESAAQVTQKMGWKNAKPLPFKSDAAKEDGYEIAVGLTNRPITKALLSKLAVDEYGIHIENGQVAVSGWNMRALKASEGVLRDCLLESLTGDAAAPVIQLPSELTLTMKVENGWKTDFPKPEGLQLYNTADLDGDDLEYLYMGEGVNAAAFNDYCKALAAAGYSKTTENEIEDSLFATFINSKEEISLYVAYNAFKYAAENDYAYAQPSLRIVSSPLKSAALPPAELLSSKSYEKKTTSAISATGLPAASSGEGYIITLEDGRFVIIDAGNTKKGGEVENFKNVLWDLQERNSGAPVSKNNPVRIAAWLLTHSHDDHYKVFIELLKQYGKSGEIFVDYVIGNLPSENQFVTCGGDFVIKANIAAYQAMLTKPFTFIKAHTGQKLYLANMEIETLLTHEDMNPHNIVTFNDSSTVMRLTINVTGGQPVTLLSTGDAYRYNGRWLCAMYGNALRSDMVTMAHHGGPAVEEQFYTYVAPTVLWWPHNTNSVHSFYLKSDNWYCKVDQHAFELPSVKYVYCSGDGHNTTLYLRADGPAYNDLYNAGFGTSLDYDNFHVIKK